MQNTGIRLQKYLAERGIASRRKCAEYVQAGRVKINGVISIEPGLRLDPAKDTVSLDGKTLSKSHERFRTIILYKPKGYICSTSDRDGKTVYELIKDIPERLVPVGRLDKDSEGLLLMSNDGDLVNRFTHPRFEHKKVYEVTVSGPLDDTVIRKLRSQMIIDGYSIQPAKIEKIKTDPRTKRHLLRFTLKEGRNRQIRNMCEQVGLIIYRLVRTKAGDLTLTGLKPGEWKEIQNTSFA